MDPGLIAWLAGQLGEGDPEQVAARITEALERLCQALGADRAALSADPAWELCWVARPARAEATSAWRALPGQPWLAARVEKLRAVRVARRAELPAEAEDLRARMALRGAEAVVLEPIASQARLAGLLELEWEVAPARLPDPQLLRAAGALMAGALARAAAEQRLCESRRAAHDLGNYLTAILGNCELDPTPLRSTAARCASAGHAPLLEIREAAERAAALVRQLASRGGCAQPVAAPLELIAAVRGCGLLLRGALGGRIALELELPDGRADVCIGELELERVLLNLAANARSAMPAGGRIRIRVGRAAEGVSLCVEDDGCGMDPETRKRAFEPFYTTRPGSGGTGLGLASVARIAAERGASLHLESAPGCGTRVTLRFPAASRA